MIGGGVRAISGDGVSMKGAAGAGRGVAEGLASREHPGVRRNWQEPSFFSFRNRMWGCCHKFGSRKQIGCSCGLINVVRWVV